MRSVVERFRAVRDAMAGNVDPESACFANVIAPLVAVENRSQGEIEMVAMLRYASPEAAAREASEEALRLLSEADAEFKARRDLYLLVKAVKDRLEQLDFESQKYLDELLKDYTRCGHGSLQGEQIKEYLQSRNTIDKMRQQFTRNIMDDVEGLWLAELDLNGVPESDMLRFRDDSKGAANRCFVPFTRDDVTVVLKYAKNPAIRKRVYTANDKKLEENVCIFRDVILRRDTNARMLGYPSHAAFRLEKRVAKTTTWVHNFLHQLQDVLLPQGEKEMVALLARKAVHLRESRYPDEYPDIMPPWDFKYYTRLAEEDLSVEHDKIAEYYPLQNTLLCMLSIFAHCLQLRFDRVEPEQMTHSVWHEDVEAWAVWDERLDTRGDFVGYLYADLLFRQNKHRGSQDVNLQGVRISCFD